MTFTDTPADAVLDTNVVLDWLVFREPSIAQLALALEDGLLRWVATQAMLDELHIVMERPSFDRWSRQIASARPGIGRWCHRVDAEPIGPGQALWCTDPDDQKFIDLALTRPVPWLFSRDRALLKLAHKARRRGVTVLTPAAWPTHSSLARSGETTGPDPVGFQDVLSMTHAGACLGSQ